MLRVPKKGYIVIPAYCPEEKLLTLVQELHQYPQLQVIVVNDGSGPSYEPVFAQVRPYAEVLEHEKNLGKGRALKTAFQEICRKRNGQPGEMEAVAVTADADGQHIIEDILKVYRTSLQHREGMVLGVRRFTRETPPRSRFGNLLTCGIFRLLTGTALTDTQTGLRGFDCRLLPFFLEIEGERYEYETNVLLAAAKKHLPFAEVPVQTVYLDGNRSSHFRIVADSLHIYWNILKFAGSSLFCFFTDYLLFAVFSFFLKHLLISNIAARLISSAVNFYLNRTYVFADSGSTGRALVKYYLLVCLILAANTMLLSLFTVQFGLHRLAAKLMAECILVLFSYRIQKCFVFSGKEKMKSEQAK